MMQRTPNPRAVAITAASALFVVALTGCKKKETEMTQPDQPEAASTSTTFAISVSLPRNSK